MGGNEAPIDGQKDAKPAGRSTSERWLARSRSLKAGILLSLAVHAGIALLVVVVWALLPLPPIRPIRISNLPNAPSRQDVGVDDEGRLPVDGQKSGG
jgi:hypothetical protein